jgi:hypothetical protein
MRLAQWSHVQTLKTHVPAVLRNNVQQNCTHMRVPQHTL